MTFLLLLFVNLSQALEVYHHLDLSIECFASYLKQKNLTDEIYKSLTVSTDISESCENGVYIEKEKLMSQALLTLMFKENFDCVRSILIKDDNFKDWLLNLRVAKSMNDFMQKITRLLTGSKTLKEKAVERIEKQLRDILSTVDMKCALTIEFGKLFDSFFEHSDEDFTPYNVIQDYCIKKELEENHFIDLAQFRIEVNAAPDHVDCKKIIDVIKMQTFETSKGEFDLNEMLQRPCVISALNEDSDYIYLLLKAELISKISLPRDQRISERQKFVDKMIQITATLREKC